MIHFHATTISDFNTANSNADINQALNNQEDSQNSLEITQNNALQGCMNGYIQALESVLRTERDYQKSPTASKGKVDLALSKQGVTDMNGLLKSVKDDLDGIKATLDIWVQYQPADTMTYTDGVTKLLKDSMITELC
ncbi:MAG: hypothetical protein WCC10_06410 [Tumebacillaceae bacterium]